MTPLQEFHWGMRTLRMLFKIIAHDIFSANYRKGIGYYVVTIVWLITITFYVSTILLDHDFYGVQLCFTFAAMLTGTSQITYKYIILRDLQQLNPIIEFFEEIYAQNSQPNSKYYAVCKRFAAITTMTVKASFVMYSLTSVFITLSGNFEWVATGHFRPCMYIYIPRVHAYDAQQYVWLMAYNYVMAVACFLLIPPGDMLFFIIFANVPLAPALMQGQLQEFEDTLTRNGAKGFGDDGQNGMDIKQRMLEYIKLLDKYNRCVQLLDKCFFKYCILLFMSASGYTVIAIFLVVMANSSVAFGIGAIGIFQISAYCMLGTIVDVAGNQIYESLHTFKWYILPRHEQRNYNMLLHYVQHPRAIYIAGIKPLNMETCLATLKVLYSSAMLLNSSVE